MKIPPTAQGNDPDKQPDPSGQMTVHLTTDGAVRFLFPSPIDVVEFDYYQAIELAKTLRKGCKKLLRDGFIAEHGTPPSDKFPYSRFGLNPDFPGTGEPPNDDGGNGT